MLIHTIGGGYASKLFFFKIEHIVSNEEKPATVTLFDSAARQVHTRYLSIPISQRQKLLADVCDEFLAHGTVSETLGLVPAWSPE